MVVIRHHQVHYVKLMVKLLCPGHKALNIQSISMKPVALKQADLV